MTYSQITSSQSTIVGPTTSSASHPSANFVLLLARGQSAFDRLALASTRSRLAELQSRGEDWDGFGSAAPRKESIEFADVSLSALHFATSRTGLPWFTPNVTANDRGEVVFEWWRGEKKLTLFFSDGFIDFIQSWGPHMDEEMDEGTTELADFAALWQWLQE